jgi:hypothetical protein
VAATARGVSLVRIKMMAFVVSAAMAGLAGALFAVQKTVVTPDDFTADFSIFFLLMVVLGGAGRLWGPVVGAVVFFLVPELLTALQSWRMLIYGVALLLLMLYAPHGLVGAIEAGWKRLRTQLGLSNIPPAPSVATARETVQPVAGAALSVRDVEKRFGGVAALAGVSLDVAAGTTHAIVGPNGSGKTTLLNMISGFYPIDSGTILIDGRSVVGMAPHRIARNGVGRTFQPPRCCRSSACSTTRCSALFRPSGRALRRRRSAWRGRGASRRLRSAMLCATSISSVSPIGRWSRRASCRTASSAWPRSPVPWSAGRACCCSTSRRRACRLPNSTGWANWWRRSARWVRPW